MAEDYYAARARNRTATHEKMRRAGYADGGATSSPGGFDADPDYSDGLEGIVDHDPKDGAPIYGRVPNGGFPGSPSDRFSGSSDPYNSAQSKRRDKDFDSKSPKKPRDK